MAISAGVEGGTSGAGGALAFEWNKTDLSQLVSGGSMDFVVGGGGGTWSVAAAPERGNVLVYTPAGGTTVTEIAMFSPTLVHATDRRDLIIEMELYDFTGVGSYFGAFFYGDADSPAHGFLHMPHGSSEWAATLNNGVVEAGGGTGVNAPPMAIMRIRGKKPVGAAPEVASYPVGWRQTTGASMECRRSGSSLAIRGGVSDIGDDSSLGATWNGTNCDRFGLAIRSGGGSPPPTQIRVMSFKVYVL